MTERPKELDELLNHVAGAIQRDIDELRRFREREPLVTELIETIQPDDPIEHGDYISTAWIAELESRARHIRDFLPCITPASTDMASEAKAAASSGAEPTK